MASVSSQGSDEAHGDKTFGVSKCFSCMRSHIHMSISPDEAESSSRGSLSLGVNRGRLVSITKNTLGEFSERSRGRFEIHLGPQGLRQHTKNHQCWTSNAFPASFCASRPKFHIKRTPLYRGHLPQVRMIANTHCGVGTESASKTSTARRRITANAISGLSIAMPLGIPVVCCSRFLSLAIFWWPRQRSGLHYFCECASTRSVVIRRLEACKEKSASTVYMRDTSDAV